MFLRLKEAMRRMVRVLLLVLCPALVCRLRSPAETLSLSNHFTIASFNNAGLTSVKDIASGATVQFAADRWSLTLDDSTLRSGDARPEVHQVSGDEIDYIYQLGAYRVEAVYHIAPSWHFVSKELKVLQTPSKEFTVHRMLPIN